MSEAVSDLAIGINTTQPTYPLLISNKAYTTSSSFPVYSPATGQLLHQFSSASVADTEYAISTAQMAFPAWRLLPPQMKRDIFLRAADIMDSRREEFEKYNMEATGAEAGWATFDATLASDIIRDVAGRISSITGSIPATAQINVNALVFKEPYGVILAVAPWNAPYILGVRSIAYPLAAGNTVVLKAPEVSPVCSYAITSCFHDAGLPEGVLNLIAHRPADAATITKSLIEHPSIKKINFTGSTAVGRIIAKMAGESLKPVLLELGGKASAIVLDDADLQLAAVECATGSFLHSGQICMSTERIIVHESIASDFEQSLKKATTQLLPSVSCLANVAGVEKNKMLLQDAVSKGATIIHGELSSASDHSAAMSPVIIKGITKEMDLYYTESFGPTVSLVTVKSDEEAIALANDTEYGLTAAVFTKDLRRGLKFAREIESGALHINGMTVHDETALPHGGMKASGYGRFGSYGLEEWVRTKTVTFKN